MNIKLKQPYVKDNTIYFPFIFCGEDKLFWIKYPLDTETRFGAQWDGLLPIMAIVAMCEGLILDCSDFCVDLELLNHIRKLPDIFNKWKDERPILYNGRDSLTLDIVIKGATSIRGKSGKTISPLSTGVDAMYTSIVQQTDMYLYIRNIGNSVIEHNVKWLAGSRPLVIVETNIRDVLVNLSRRPEINYGLYTRNPMIFACTYYIDQVSMLFFNGTGSPVHDIDGEYIEINKCCNHNILHTDTIESSRYDKLSTIYNKCPHYLNVLQCCNGDIYIRDSPTLAPTILNCSRCKKCIRLLAFGELLGIKDDLITFRMTDKDLYQEMERVYNTNTIQNLKWQEYLKYRSVSKIQVRASDSQCNQPDSY